MGYLTDFPEDGFISYAHGDDDKFGSERIGWVSQLHVDLKKRVAARLGRGDDSGLWRDCDIRSNEDFEKKISKRLASTATLLSVMSPNFFGREWCIRELREFVSHAEQTFGLRVSDDKSRIFKIEKLPVNRNILPEVLQGIGSYKFYGEDPERPGRVMEFRPQLGPDHLLKYFMVINELAEDIAKVLQAMSDNRGGPRQPESPSLAVYIAETTSDLDEIARGIRRDLKARGYQVLPQGDLPSRIGEFRGKVQEALKGSAMSVHLIGNTYGFVPEGETEKSSTWLQNELAIERESDPNFVRMVWMPDGIQPSDPRQHTFIEHLWSDSGAKKFTDVHQEKVEEFKGIIEAKLREIKGSLKHGKDATAPRSQGDGSRQFRSPCEPLRVYVICDQLDRKSQHLQDLKKFLFQLGYETFLPMQESNDEREAIQVHLDNLEICDACLIYYGAGSEGWFEAKLADFRKFLSRRRCPILAKGIYLAPPFEASKDALLVREAIVQRGAEDFTPDRLAEFLTQLSQNQGTRRPS